MANTYVLIASNTVGSGGASSVTFSSIPATYTDLIVKVSARSGIGSVADTMHVLFNSSTTTYTYKSLEGNGASASSGNTANNWAGTYPGNGATASTFGNTEIYIPNYAGTTYKSYSVDSISETNGTTTYADLDAGLWSTTTAISSVSIATDSNNFVQYSTFYLYGISKS